MPRVQFSDVVPPDKRSIRNIPIPSGSRRAKPLSEVPKVEPQTEDISAINIKYSKDDSSFGSGASFANKIAEQNKEKSSFQNKVGEGSPAVASNYYYDNKHPGLNLKPKRRFAYGGIAVLIIIGFVAVMMTVFASANIAIVPKTESIPISIKIKAGPETSTSTIRYEVIKITKEKSVSVKASGEEEVETKASGKIVVYNNYSSDPQRLITRTRFETKDGLIYRIAESIVVPGKTAKGPGSIEVEVFADEPGEKYNVSKSDFTIPGFKNDPQRYAGFYARSAGNMEGGVVGKVKKVEESEKAKAMASLEADLKMDVERELSAQTPEGLVSLGENIIYQFRELSQKDDVSGVTLGKEVMGFAIMLRREDLSKLIIKSNLEGAKEWVDIPVKVSDFTELKITEKPKQVDPNNPIDLKLDGKVTAMAEVSISVVSERLAGVPRSDISEAMKSFPGIESIKATIRPVWKQSFPDNPLKIYVQIEDGK